MTEVTVGDRRFEAVHVRTGNSNVLMIRAGEGFLGCGYFRVDVADRNGDPVAIVRGVRTPADMLEARVEEVSESARAKGVRPGMKGHEAILRLSGGEGASAA
jgi:uncharacterized protein YunC (DUF1805 family)